MRLDVTSRPTTMACSGTEHRRSPRCDLTYRWHRAPPSAADGPSGQAANLSRAGRSHSVVPTLSPGTAAPQAPSVMPTSRDAQRPIRAHSAWRVTPASGRQLLRSQLAPAPRLQRVLLNTPAGSR